MKPTVDELVRKALELDKRERAEVAARLLGSLDDEEDADEGHRSRVPSHSRKSARFETRVFDLGPCRLEGLDDIARALTLAEGEGFK
jgi:hypothetical protein